MSIDIPYKEDARVARRRDSFNTPRRHAKYDVHHARGETDRPDIVLKAWQIHARCYVDFGYFSEDALTDSDTLPVELDGTREKAGTPLSVNYLLAVPKGGDVDAAGGTLRIIDADPGEIASLPTYKYFDHESTAYIGERIKQLVDHYGAENIREIAAMSVLDDHLASYELMRALVHNALLAREETNREEVYLTSLTNRSLGPVVDLVGAGAAVVLGEAVKIFQDDPRANRRLMVTPVLFEPCRIPFALTEEINTTSDKARRQLLTKRLFFFVDGLTREQIGPDVAAFLDTLETTD